MYRNLKAEMGRNGDNQFDLARILNCDRSTVKRKMDGKTAFTKNEIDVLLDHYGMTYEYLFADE